MLDEIVEAAKLLCQGEHSQLYLVEGDVLAIFWGSSDTVERLRSPEPLFSRHGTDASL